MKITKEDFDNAVKLSWSTKTCVIAQACKRQNPDLIDKDSGEMVVKVYDTIANNKTVQTFMRSFDNLFINGELINATGADQLRNMLPLELSV